MNEILLVQAPFLIAGVTYPDCEEFCEFVFFPKVFREEQFRGHMVR
jgi:hypothetical protein